MLSINKIISGGQTGADQAALDVAIALQLDYGGWLPPGRMTERGPLPSKYKMQVMEKGGYPDRTRKNVEVADGTLIISHGSLLGGSALTANYAKKRHKPCLHIDLDSHHSTSHTRLVQSWLCEKKITILNVAGPRASSDQRIYDATMHLLKEVFGQREESGRGL